MKTFPTNSEDKKMHSIPAHTAATVSPGKDMMKPIKPKRPLTAYHIYLAIEKEFIIQSIPGENADKSADDDKVYLDYVPERYRQTKLSPDWYFGPGKKKRRKHRKQHGKIGFKELTTIISERWAKLDETNPDIKRFVQNLANQGLMEYRREMEEYEKHADSVASAKSTNTLKRTVDSDVQSEDNVPNQLHKKPRQMQRCVSELFSVDKTAETVGKTECPEEANTPCLSTVISTDLKAFQYRPARKHHKNSISTSNAGKEEQKSYRRRISVDDFKEMAGNLPTRVVSVDGFEC
jgi:hypothetical protein